MRYALIAIPLLMIAPDVVPEEHAPVAGVDLRVMTFNILVDWEIKPGTLSWTIRKPLVIQAIKEADPDLAGFQESSPKQAAFLQQQLTRYASLGIVPLTQEDIDYLKAKIPGAALFGMTKYTDVLLFYKEDRFEVVDQGHWWMASNPEKLSTDFGNTFPRIVVWARLKHKSSNRELYVIVTHFDNTMPSQVEMAKLSHELIEEHLDTSLPMLFLGDFNTDPARGDYKRLSSAPWTDSYRVCPQASADGNDNNVATVLNGDERIDHVFYRGPGLKAVEWRRIESPDPTKKLSDHYPVLAVIRWE